MREVAELLGLTEFLERKPGQLSGGQRQRVAMGRAIVRQPSVFLMDEPLSNLDAKLRVQMRADIAELQARLGTTTVYVTHDQAEAMTLGHRVAVLKDGLLQQCDAPRVLYDRPGQRVRGGIHRVAGDESLHGSLWRERRRLARRGGRGGVPGGRPGGGRRGISDVVVGHPARGSRPRERRHRRPRRGGRGARRRRLRLLCRGSPGGATKLVARVEAARRPSGGLACGCGRVPSEALLFHPVTGDRLGLMSTQSQDSPKACHARRRRTRRSSSADGYAFTAGQVGFDAQGDIVAGGIAAQTRQALENLRACLAAAGCTMDDVVKVTAFLVDLGDFAAYNEVYA